MLIFFILFMAVYSQTNYSKEKILAKSENELKLAPLALNISAQALTPPTLPFSLPLNNSLAFRTVPSPPLIVAPTCLTPNVIPITITSSITLCGNIRMTASSRIGASNVVVTCDPGTIITKALTNTAHNGIYVPPGFTNVQINGCTFEGKFDNAIKLDSRVKNSFISNNIINGSIVGIKEEANSTSNTYSGNTIRNSYTGMHLEGSRGIVVNSTISQNVRGIVTGTDPAGIIPSPLAVCSSGFIIYTCPLQIIQMYCSMPQNGQRYVIQNNIITKNNEGILIWALDNLIIGNSINYNIDGIKVNSIYTGSEINPGSSAGQCGMNNVQEYFQSGSQIYGNSIMGNTQTGIKLSGRSTYFYASSTQFIRSTNITLNIISQNGVQGTNYGEGIIVGSKENTIPYLSPDLRQDWREYTQIAYNQINNNVNDGIILKNGGGMTDLLVNVIELNGKNGIRIGSPQQTNGFSMNYGASRYIYQNEIKNNFNNGIETHYSNVYRTVLNKINNNNKSGIYASDPSIYHNPFFNEVICNDISLNQNEGFNYDLQTSPSSSNLWHVNQFTKNRVLRNGADGVRYSAPGSQATTTSLFQIPNRMRTNLIQENGFNPNPSYLISGYGLNVNGFSYSSFFTNNFIGNNLGPAYDSGNRTIENMYDERQHELAYDNIYCKNCGGFCNTDLNCGMYSGTCVNNICQAPPGSGLTCNPLTGNVDCYANPTLLPWTSEFYSSAPGTYVPRGNFGLGAVVPPSATPPLQPNSCTTHFQCATHSCESYPAPTNNNQCGNGNLIPEPSMFTGYYLPGIAVPCQNIPGFYPATVIILPPSTHPGGESTEFIEPITDFQEENNLYGNMLEEEDRNNFREILKDRAYLKQKMVESQK